jgi:hypothetical protein
MCPPSETNCLQVSRAFHDQCFIIRTSLFIKERFFKWKEGESTSDRAFIVENMNTTLILAWIIHRAPQRVLFNVTGKHNWIFFSVLLNFRLILAPFYYAFLFHTIYLLLFPKKGQTYPVGTYPFF